MTYLQLAQMVHRLIGAGDATPGSVPTDMAALPSGLQSEIGSWVNDAYREIVLDQDHWRFMLKPFEITAVQSTAGSVITITNTLAPTGTATVNYADSDPYYGLRIPYTAFRTVVPSTSSVTGAITDFQSIEPLIRGDEIRYMLVADSTTTGYSLCYYVNPKNFHGFFDTVVGDGMPTRFTTLPDGGIALDRIPDKSYRFRCDYRQVFTEMSASTDLPVLPERYHTAIAYRAVAMYAEQRVDTERYSQFQRRYTDILTDMRGDETPEVTFDMTQLY